ncbi:MAG: thermonuclease family protein [Candidatus Altiarchaeota archaeon]|nr:thermonuclease family protein [Candidatus Altiarchaeota archaeon]
MWKILYAVLLLIYPAVDVSVERVIDGDTIETSIGRVRILNINTPERGERCYEGATEFLKTQIGNTVEMERDFVNKDKYDRLLRHIHSDGLIGTQLVENGFAKSYCVFPNTKYCEEVVNAQLVAMTGRKGCLWRPSNDTCLHIEDVSKAGNWVEVLNHCNYVVNTSSTYIESDGRQREYLSEELCSKCTVQKSLSIGNFVLLSNSGGFIDYRAS